MPCLGAGQACGASLSSGVVDALLDRDLNPSPRSIDMLRRESSNPGELLIILGGPAALAVRADDSSRRRDKALGLKKVLFSAPGIPGALVIPYLYIRHQGSLVPWFRLYPTYILIFFSDEYGLGPALQRESVTER